LVRDLLRHEEYLPVGFLDDAPAKHGRELHGVRVLGPISELTEVATQLAVDVVLIAIPSASSSVMRKIVDVCNELQLPCRTLPSLRELADGRAEVSRLREIRIEDLPGREPVQLNDRELHQFIDDKCVLVTGAGGSIGSELCRQVLKYKPAQLILLEQNEYNLYRISQEIEQHEHADKIVILLGDVRDEASARQVFDEHRPNIVLHAAAYKHVPLVEDNPDEGVKTNVFGTVLLANIATEYKVEKFIQVSTDKAVNPTNVMGASKRVGEIYCQSLNDQVATQFITTRFGNVLDSKGSVVPLFRKQINSGGPVTVTHPDVTRYFMTIPEAVRLILQAAAMGNGGEIFVLDMGKPIKIVDLATQMIHLSGHEPGEDIGIQFIGLRPGEKLHEELFHESENLLGTEHPKILLAESRTTDWDVLTIQLAKLHDACRRGDRDVIREALKTIVPEFSLVPLADIEPVIPTESPRTVH